MQGLLNKIFTKEISINRHAYIHSITIENNSERNTRVDILKEQAEKGISDINIFAGADYKNFNFYRYLNKNPQAFKSQIIKAVKMSSNSNISTRSV